MYFDFLTTLQLVTTFIVTIFILICVTDKFCLTYLHIRQMYRQRYLQ